MVGYTPTSFTDLDFASKKIEVDLKRGKFNHPAWTNEKIGANKEGEDEGETHAALSPHLLILNHAHLQGFPLELQPLQILLLFYPQLKSLLLPAYQLEFLYF